MSIIAASCAAVRPGPMSELGQNRKLPAGETMFAILPEADIRRHDALRWVFDHLASAAGRCLSMQ